MKTKVQVLREEKGMTQSELAERSGLSLRTIQRVEAGSTPKGFTLQALVNALDIEPMILTAAANTDESIQKAKLINLATLTSMVIPFGNLIFPSILIYKLTDNHAKDIGKQILEVQVIYTVIFGIALILLPVLMKELGITTPLFLVVIAIMQVINLFTFLLKGASLSENGSLRIRLKTSFV